MENEKQMIEIEMNSLIKEYKTRIFSIKQVCQILGKSPATLKRWRDLGIKLEYKKDNSSKNSVVEYSARSVAKYIVKNDIKVN